MEKTIIICAGKNTSSRIETAETMKAEKNLIIIESSDSTVITSQLKVYDTMELPVVLFYFFTPNKAIIAIHNKWSEEMRDKIKNLSLRTYDRAQVKFNINADTGGGFVMFMWDTISSGNLEQFCQVLNKVF